MIIHRLIEEDPEERHLKRYPKGREGTDNGNFDRGSSTWLGRRWDSRRKES